MESYYKVCFLFVLQSAPKIQRHDSVKMKIKGIIRQRKKNISLTHLELLQKQQA